MKEKALLGRKECKNIQMQLLKIADDVCKKNGLNYYLAYGTMLGAIRHKGYIPWDDDIDIYMERDDYEKFIAIFKNEAKGIPNWCEILDLTPHKYYYPFAKLVDSRTVAKMDNNLTKHGIWVDIFPVDGLPENVLISRVFCFYCHCLRAMIIAMTTDFSSKKLGKKVRYKKILAATANIIGKDRLAKIYDNTCRAYKVKGHNYAACLSSAYGSRDRMQKKILFEKEFYEFEGSEFIGCKSYDVYLSSLYGDYMILPPEESRRVHSITAWKVEKERI